ncbi:MAG: hypothetical protein NT166_21195 [Candidatus Aminicenantes bacterium]|nr:hypothetical protein [Candidatus Aminicenantes bacterium]
MKKEIILGITILLLCVFVNGQDQKTFELIDTDILFMDSKITSKNLTVRGISVDMPILDVLTKFGKNISDIDFSIKYSSHMLTIEPGLEIITDKDTVKSIIVTQDFKYLKGKTKDLFDLKTGVKALYFLFMNLGEPIGLKSKEPVLGGDNYEIIYSNGLSFTFLHEKFDKQPAITIKILSILPELPDNKNVERWGTQNSNTKTSSFYNGAQNSNMKTSHSYKSNAVAVQCHGYTKKGKRCKNKTTDPSGYCYEHR